MSTTIQPPVSAAKPARRPRPSRPEILARLGVGVGVGVAALALAIALFPTKPSDKQLEAILLTHYPEVFAKAKNPRDDAFRLVGAGMSAEELRKFERGVYAEQAWMKRGGFFFGGFFLGAMGAVGYAAYRRR